MSFKSDLMKIENENFKKNKAFFCFLNMNNLYIFMILMILHFSN